MCMGYHPCPCGSSLVINRSGTIYQCLNHACVMAEQPFVEGEDGKVCNFKEVIKAFVKRGGIIPSKPLFSCFKPFYEIVGQIPIL